MVEIRQQDKSEYRRLLDEIGEEYCNKDRYCIFKEFLIAAHPSRRLLVQLKCCDKAKFLWSKDGGQDLGWDETMKRWITDGHAKRFAEVYKEDMPPKEVFKLVFECPDQKISS